MLPGLLPKYILEFEFFNEPTLWNRLQKHLIFFLSLSNYLAVKAKIYLVRFCNLLNTGFGWFGWIPHLQTAVATLVYWIKIRKINNSSIFNTIKAWNNKTYIQLWTERIAHLLFYGVKLPKLQAVWTGHGGILPLVKWGHLNIWTISN